MKYEVMFCFVRRVQGKTASKITFLRHFSGILTLLEKTSIHSPAHTFQKYSGPNFCLLRFMSFFFCFNDQDSNRIIFILSKTFEINNKHTLGLLCEKDQYKLEWFIARWLIGS